MEANNMKAIRDALVEIDELTNLLDVPEDKQNLLVSPSHSFIAVKMRKIVKKALEEPPRNCDVGTPEEQNERFNKFCCAHKCCHGCPLDGEPYCQLAWSQMPYTESEATDGHA